MSQRAPSRHKRPGAPSLSEKVRRRLEQMFAGPPCAKLARIELDAAGYVMGSPIRTAAQSIYAKAARCDRQALWVSVPLAWRERVAHAVAIMLAHDLVALRGQALWSALDAVPADLMPVLRRELSRLRAAAGEAQQ